MRKSQNKHSDLRLLQRIKMQATREFGGIQGIIGFGIGKNTLRVYIHDDNIRSLLPNSYKGLGIECVISDEIVAQQST